MVYGVSHKPPPVTQNNFAEEAARLDAREPGRWVGVSGSGVMWACQGGETPYFRLHHI